MTKNEAVKELISVIDQLKLSKPERDHLYKAVTVLAEEPKVEDDKSKA